MVDGDGGHDAGGSDTGDSSGCSTGSTPDGKCKPGSSCTADTDCASGVCAANGICVKATCANGEQDGNETGPDCGGDCPSCIGDACSRNAHCVSNYCNGGECAAPSCTDKEKNGRETGVDCGGNCEKCPVGDGCRTNSDCKTGRCIEGTCAELPASCSDDEKNGQETDIDCGGPECGACPLDRECNEDTDCLTNFCNFGICKRPTCSDDIQNQGESDKDCGGDNCDPCAIGDSCNGNVDCQTNRCASGTCASCSDGTQNGAETGTDCGGPCEPCADGGSCSSGGDCQSGRCTDGFCATCSDGKKSGAETDVDCGGPCGPCGGGASCSTHSDCQTNLCESGSCCVENTEICDGQDNDCDGDVDEGCSCTNGATQKCGQSTGACSKGTQTCSDGRWGTCQGGQDPQQESCDGNDNDCDGVTDEGCSCDYRQKSDGVCTGAAIDNSGNCSRPSDYESTERSCDGKDNDCDGTVDGFCAPFAKVWGDRDEDSASDIEMDSSGNLYVVGTAGDDLFGETNEGRNDAFIAKFDSDGNRLWGELLGTKYDEQGYGVTVDGSDVYISGYTKGHLAGNRLNGKSDYFVAKYSTRGTRDWVTTDGGSRYDVAWDVTVGPGGDVYFSGKAGTGFDGQSHDHNADVLVGRLSSSSGDSRWHRIWGGGGKDIGYALDSSGSTVYVGSTVDHKNGSLSGFILKYDSGGDRKDIWTVVSQRDDDIFDILVDGSSLFISGQTEGTLGNSRSGRADAYVARLSTSGSVQWLQQFGTSRDDKAYGLELDSNGDFYATGVWEDTRSGGEAFVTRFTSQGTRQWTKFGKSTNSDDEDWGNSVIADDDDNAYVVGGTKGDFDGESNNGESDSFLWRVKKIK